MSASLPKTLVKFVGLLLASVLAAGFLVLLFVHGANLRPTSAALNLSHYLEHLKVGGSFDEAVLIKSYHAEKISHPRLPDGTLEPIHDVCQNDADVWYRINVNSISPIWESRLLPLYRVGLLHRWGAASTVYVRGNKVLCVTQRIALTSDVRSDLYIISATSELIPSPRNGEVWHENYRVDAGTMKARMLNVTALPSASKDQLQSLFKLNLDCISSLRPCRYPCEIMPSAWEQYVKINHDARWPGPLTEDDGRCARLLDRRARG